MPKAVKKATKAVKRAAAKPAKTHSPKIGKRTAVASEVLTLRWNVHALPSSQHKAGLAGLALWLKYLERLPDRKGICDLGHLDVNELEMRVDQVGMQILFDKVYAASTEHIERDKKFQKKLANGKKVDVEPLAVRERAEVDKNGKKKTKTIFVYPQTVPDGGLIDDWDDSESKVWRKLWRDMIWGILRGVPATREPYDARAEDRTCPDGSEAWEELSTAGDSSVDLPSTYYLGAQAKSAENVSFQDRARNRILLHFWPFAVPIYVPVVVDRDGNRDFNGYVFAVPDIVDLEGFVANWETFVRSRRPDISGYRPRDALIDVAAEAALDVTARVFALLGDGKAHTPPWIGSVDTFHLEKDGNNIRTRGIARVEVKRDWIGQYQRVRDTCWSPLFRRQVILNVLEGEPWWRGFGRLCAIEPEGLTIKNTAFRHDCREISKEARMAEQVEDQKPHSLEHVTFQIARSYVYGRLKSKYGMDWTKAKGDEAARGAYGEKKDKIAREAFLAVRSRTGADFVAYFTGTLCSINQRIGQEGFLLVANALHDADKVEHVRSLTLLALSAA
jgi:CRISPR-associated protein Cmx8